MRRPPFLLWGHFPSASVPQGSSWWICVGRFVLLVPPAPPVPAEAASPWQRALQGCLLPGCLGPLKAAVRLWRRASGCLIGRPVPLKALASPWWPSPPDYLLPDRPGPVKALATSLRRAPPRCLLQGLLGAWKAAVRSWRRAAPLGCVLRRLGVPLKVLVSPWWQPPDGCLAPPVAPWRRATSDRLVPVVVAVSPWCPPLQGCLVPAGSMASVLSGAGLESPAPNNLVAVDTT